MNDEIVKNVVMIDPMLLQAAYGLIALLIVIVGYFVKQLINKINENNKKTNEMNLLLVKIGSDIALKNQSYDTNIQTITTNISKVQTDISAVQTDMGKMESSIQDLSNKFSNHIKDFHNGK